MSDFEWCYACRTMHLHRGSHYPLYDVRLEDDEQEWAWVPIRARDAEEAAERYMEYAWGNHDGWEWIIPKSGEGLHVVLARDAGGKVAVVNVTAEMRPHYSCVAET